MIHTQITYILEPSNQCTINNKFLLLKLIRLRSIFLIQFGNNNNMWINKRRIEPRENSLLS